MRARPVSEVAIRRATLGDATFIHELSQLAFAEYDPHAARATATMMLEAGAQTLVAERDGTPLGFVILDAQSSAELAINAIAVSPRERGKRIGQRPHASRRAPRSIARLYAHHSVDGPGQPRRPRPLPALGVQHHSNSRVGVEPSQLSVRELASASGSSTT
jgi:hypothetical protein